MSSVFRRFRTGIFTLGAFGLGLGIENRFHIFADSPESLAKKQNQLISGSDSVDGLVLNKGPTGSGAVQPSNSYVSRIARHGFPSNDSLRSYANFVISYDRRNRVAHWVLEHLTKESLLSDSYDRSGVEFIEDGTFHRFFRATNADYKGSGYDRGHLAASGNYRANREHMKETFVLSNIAPQVGRGFNRDKWNELEKYARSKVHQADAQSGVWICSGPLYLPQRELTSGKLLVKYEVIGRNHVSVPTHFFKVLLYQKAGTYCMESFLLPNSPIPNEKPLNLFRVDPEVIERASGLLLFSSLPRNAIKLIK